MRQVAFTSPPVADEIGDTATPPKRVSAIILASFLLVLVGPESIGVRVKGNLHAVAAKVALWCVRAIFNGEHILNW